MATPSCGLIDSLSVPVFTFSYSPLSTAHLTAWPYPLLPTPILTGIRVNSRAVTERRSGKVQSILVPEQFRKQTKIECCILLPPSPLQTPFSLPTFFCLMSPPRVTNHLRLSGTIQILELKILLPGIAFSPRQTRTLSHLTRTQPGQYFSSWPCPDSVTLSQCHCTSTHSVNKYILSPCYMLSTVLGEQNRHHPCLHPSNSLLWKMTGH